MKISSKSILLVAIIALTVTQCKQKYHRKVTCDHDKHNFELQFVDIPVENDPTQTHDLQQTSQNDGGMTDRAGIHHANDQNKDKHDRNLQQTYPNMRIYPYYNITTGDLEFTTYVKNELMPAVINFFQKALKVRNPLSTNLSVPSYLTTVCGEPTPSVLLSGGVVADLALLVTSFEEVDTSAIAYGSPCFLQSTTSRPIVGLIGFNTAAFGPTGGDPLVHEYIIQTTLHEVSHVLGFSINLFNYFRYPNGTKRTGQVFKRTYNGYTYSVLNVEPLTSKLRTHFGCSSLEGAVMENQGGSGTAGSHFERRIFGYEFMTGSVVPDMKVSEFTLALFEGSGWYIPDYNMSEPITWGQGEGCTFVNGSCMYSGKPRFDEFCAAGSFGCSPTGRAAVSCTPYDSFADNCYWYLPLGQLDCEDPATLDYALLPNEEAYGATAGSKCFTGNLAQGFSFTGNYGYCFKYTCEGSGLSTVLKVQIGLNTVLCSAAGSVTVSGMTGKLNCPDPLKFCSTIGKPYCKRGCMGNGNCVNGQCQCYLGWKGVDCGMKA